MTYQQREKDGWLRVRDDNGVGIGWVRQTPDGNAWDAVDDRHGWTTRHILRNAAEKHIEFRQQHSEEDFINMLVREERLLRQLANEAMRRGEWP